MNKNLRTLIVGMAIAFFLVITPPLLMAQNAPSPQSNPVTSESISTPVILEGQTLFVLRNPLGNFSSQERAKRASQNIKDFANNQALSLDSIEIYAGDKDGLPITVISADRVPLFSLANADAKSADKSRSELAQEYSQKIKDAVSSYRKERSFQYLLKAILWSVFATFILVLAMVIINNIFARIYQKIKVWEESYIHPVRLGNWELIRANQLDDILAWLIRITQAIIILGLLAFYFPFVFRQFPWTRSWAKAVEGYLLETLQAAGKAFAGYLPSLLTIILVMAATWFLLRLSKPFFRELGEGRFSLPGFYAEWADATHRLVSFLIIALAAVIIFPLLPGFQSPAFQGISVFLGLLISLGSTSVISNLVSGSVLIYTRAFRVGDRIKIGEISGKVLETTLLVTRILTPTNVVISIPNSQISTSSIENFSFGYREFKQPLILRTSVYLGYEVPWREAYQALIQSALQTKGILPSPEPFVLQGELNEVYVTYLLNAYIDVEYFKDKTLKEVEMAHSELNENIRDCCNRNGIRIFAPSYEADPTNYGPAMKQNLTSDVED